MAGNVVEFTDANFSTEVLSSDAPVVVDFWAPWCGPCKSIAPVIEELATQFAGQAKIGKVNTDDNPQVAMDHGISAIPTIMIFKGGEVVQRFVGITPKTKLADAITGQL
ncbi:MAG: thioredoxin [Planctomycetaceae bacterium]|jgi:thioredoxin 1|nr:thioredoxin [Planctomycetaceae bacterium]